MEDGVFEFANVARPPVGGHAAQGGGGNVANFLPVFVGEPAGEIPGQQRNVVKALAQRRDKNLDDIQPVEEIVAEAAGGDTIFEMAVAGGNQMDVHGNGVLAADPLKGAGFEDAEHLGLDAQADVRDFVEEEGSTVGAFEAAGALHGGAGERAFFVPKQFALQ